MSKMQQRNDSFDSNETKIPAKPLRMPKYHLSQNRHTETSGVDTMQTLSGFSELQSVVIHIKQDDVTPA